MSRWQLVNKALLLDDLTTLKSSELLTHQEAIEIYDALYQWETVAESYEGQPYFPQPVGNQKMIRYIEVGRTKVCCLYIRQFSALEYRFIELTA